MKKPAILSATFVRNIRQPGRYGDGRGGHGLALLVRVRKNGRVARYWVQTLRLDGKVISLGLGVFPVTTLKEAREKALENRRAVSQGRNPRENEIPSFEAAAGKVIRLKASQWKAGRTEAIWRGRLEKYAFPVMGNKRVDQITSADVMACLTPIWHTKGETGRKLQSYIGQIMKWAIAQGYRKDDPTSAVGAALGSNRNGGPKHLRALPHAEVAGALRTIEKSGAMASTVQALRFLAMTATRSGEVRLARWGEIDMATRTWTIPAERTKTGKAHRVPLSSAALGALAVVWPEQNILGLVFQSRTGRALGDTTLSKLFRDLEIPAVPHGLRSSFRDWCAETGVRREVAEASLAHVVGGVEGAYNRTDLLEARREIMERWGVYLTAEPIS